MASTGKSVRVQVGRHVGRAGCLSVLLPAGSAVPHVTVSRSSLRFRLLLVGQLTHCHSRAERRTRAVTVGGIGVAQWLGSLSRI